MFVHTVRDNCSGELYATCATKELAELYSALMNDDQLGGFDTYILYRNEDVIDGDYIISTREEVFDHFFLS